MRAANKLFWKVHFSVSFQSPWFPSERLCSSDECSEKGWKKEKGTEGNSKPSIVTRGGNVLMKSCCCGSFHSVLIFNPRACLFLCLFFWNYNLKQPVLHCAAWFGYFERADCWVFWVMLRYCCWPGWIHTWLVLVGGKKKEYKYQI